MSEIADRSVEDWLAELEEEDRATKPIEAFRTPLRCPQCGSTEILGEASDAYMRCAPHGHIVCRRDEMQDTHDQQTLENIGAAVDRVFRWEN